MVQVYRFRKMENLLNPNMGELSEQTICFSVPD